MVAHRPCSGTSSGHAGGPVSSCSSRPGDRAFAGLQTPYDVVDRIAPRPLLLIHGTGDWAVDWAHSEALYAKAGGPRDLWLADMPDTPRCSIAIRTRIVLV